MSRAAPKKSCAAKDVALSSRLHSTESFDIANTWLTVVTEVNVSRFGQTHAPLNRGACVLGKVVFQNWVCVLRGRAGLIECREQYVGKTDGAWRKNKNRARSGWHGVLKSAVQVASRDLQFCKTPKVQRGP